MVEPIGVASGLLTLVLFGLQSSTSLYQTIKGFNSHQRHVRELREEVEALTLVLSSLNDAVSSQQSDFTALKLPLLRCGNACKDFEVIILKGVEHEGGARANFKGWAKMKYMGDDITAFKSMVAGYKSTITIALCDANLRSSSVTTSVLNEYQEKINETMSDLEEYLQKIDDKLKRLLEQGIDSDTHADEGGLRNEKECILKCLNICTEVSSHIDSVRTQIPQSSHTSSGENMVIVSANEAVTRNTEQVLGRCKDDLTGVLSQLNLSLEDVSRRQQILYQRPASLNQHNEQKKLQDEIESIKQSLAICTEASKKAHSERTNVFEDVSLKDDSHQVMVSTFGDLVFAKKVSAGARSRQWLGQMSDESLQELSRMRYQADPGLASKVETEMPSQFEITHGQGRNLAHVRK